MTRFAKMLATGAAGAAVLGGIALAPLAARDPAYQSARTNGLIGEQPDGYLGVVGSADAATQALVRDINNQRREAYFESARQEGVTPKRFAFFSGCQLILNTSPGEKYKTPDGQWVTRTSQPPILDPDCPRKS